VAEFESVVGAGGGDDVLAFGVAHAVRGDFDVRAGLGGFDDLLQRDGGAGGGVELGLVMGLGDGEFDSLRAWPARR
jgi:hypothetical protein